MVLYVQRGTSDSFVVDLKVQYILCETLRGLMSHPMVRYILCETLDGSIADRKVRCIVYGTIEGIVYWTSMSTVHSPFCFADVPIYILLRFNWKSYFILVQFHRPPDGLASSIRNLREIHRLREGFDYFIQNLSECYTPRDGSGYLVRNP